MTGSIQKLKETLIYSVRPEPVEGQCAKNKGLRQAQPERKQINQCLLKQRAFTLVELLVVMAIIATLLSIVVPRYFQHLDLARENSLKQTLSVLRDTIDKYHADTGSYPESFDELIKKRYLRRLPVDPISESSDTWTLIPPPQSPGSRYIWDVRSGAEGNAGDGTAYSDW